MRAANACDCWFGARASSSALAYFCSGSPAHCSARASRPTTRSSTRPPTSHSRRPPSTGSAPTASGATSSHGCSQVRGTSCSSRLRATLLATLFGTTLGLITGYFRGIADDTISRVIDAVLAIPLIVLAVTVVSAVGSRAAWAVAVVIAIVFTPIIARTVRAAVLGEAQLDYVEAARLRGERSHVRDVRGGASERDAADPRRGDHPARVCNLRCRHAHVHRVRSAAALTGLGRSDLGQLAVPRAAVVDGALSRRSPSRRSSSRSTSSRTASSRCSSDEFAGACRNSSCASRISMSLPRPRERSAGPARGDIRGRLAASPTGSSASRAAGSRRLRSRSSATCRATDASPADRSPSPDATCSACAAQSCANTARATVSMVYQNPGAALNPSIRVGTQVAEVFTVLGAPAGDATERARAALERVQIADPGSVMRRYPHQLSGGMQQRVADRDGAREGSRAADPRRADDRARRDGRGGGARPRRRASRRSCTPRCSSSATTSA